MTPEYRFTLDRDLRVKTWDDRMQELTGEPASAAKGKKYYQVFPRVFFRESDAAAFSMEKRKRVSIKKHAFHCFFSSATADLIVQPLLTSKGVKGAEIRVSNIALNTSYTTEEIRHLIAMGKAASTLAHGIRNPLNALQGAVVVISNKYAGEKILMEFSRIMQEEITRLDNFITKFLSASFDDTGPAPVDLNAVLKKVEVLIKYQAHTRNIRSDFRYGLIRPALVNPFQVEQAVLNIINNAFEAVGSDGGLIVKTGMSRYSENDFIEIEISDDGPGILGENQHDTVNRRMNGKGYGLKITEEIMNNCGGRMQIQSTAGRGTSVKLYIPAKKSGGIHGEQRQGKYTGCR
jgi:two-component system, NtrC family, nitrogen regulation sensor histidine kinase GlnL